MDIVYYLTFPPASPFTIKPLTKVSIVYLNLSLSLNFRNINVLL
jgi:hypothetical protein